MSDNYLKNAPNIQLRIILHLRLRTCLKKAKPITCDAITFDKTISIYTKVIVQSLFKLIFKNKKRVDFKFSVVVIDIYLVI